MTPRTRYLALALVLSCASSSVGAQAPRDSAGIRVVDNSAPLWTPGREWRLSEKPILDISAGSSPADTLGRIESATRLSDGRVVLVDDAVSRLRFYDASGRHLQSVSPTERGESDLQNINSITRLAGDSIAVEVLRWTAIVAPSGAFVRNVTYGPFPEGALQIPFVHVMGRFDNGTAVVMDYPQGHRRPGDAKQWVDSSNLFLVDRSGRMVRPLGTVPMVVFVAGETRPSPMDLGPQAPHASTGRAMYVGFSDRYAIRVYNADWKLERIIRRAWTPRRLTGSEIDAYVDGWMQMWSEKTGAEREAERKAMRADAYPDTLPAYSAILVTSTGELWVREPDMTGAPGCWCLAGLSTVPSRWSVFDPGGRWLGDVSMPPRFIPLEIGTEYVLGRSRDENRRSHAVMYRIEKTR